MRLWVKIIAVALVGFGSWAAYDAYRYGYFSMPDVPEDGYTISFKNGLRGIVLGAELPNDGGTNAAGPFQQLSDANPNRRYLGIPFTVPSWFETSWSECSPPSEEERIGITSEMPAETLQQLRGARFDFVCRFDVDGETIYRGVIYSVPKI